MFLGFLICALFYSFSEAGFRFGTMSWFFLLLVIIGAGRAVSLANSHRPVPLKPANIAPDELAYATQGVSLLSH